MHVDDGQLWTHRRIGRCRTRSNPGSGLPESSFLEGRTCRGLADLSHQVTAWVDTAADVRVDFTTGERRIDRYRREERRLGDTG